MSNLSLTFDLATIDKFLDQMHLVLSAITCLIPAVSARRKSESILILHTEDFVVFLTYLLEYQ